MNRGRVFIALITAFMLSIGITAFLYRRVYANGIPRATREVVAAAETLRPGSAPVANQLKLIAWPANVPIEGTFSKIEDVAGHALIYPVDAGEPVRQRDIASAGSGFGLTAKIPEGMRAAAVKTDEVVAVGGYLYPGCHVDVLLSYRPEQNQAERTVTVLEDVQVLSAGDKMDPDPQAKPDVKVTAVTLLVTPEQSERLVWATSQGKVQFVLRNGADKEVRGVPKLADLMAQHKEPKPAGPMRKVTTVSAPAAYEVETVAGDKRSVAKFQP